MVNNLNQDFVEFIDALNKASVRYILVGGYAVIYHGYNLTTGDLDIWVEATKENYQCLKKAFSIFGMSLFNLTEERFCDTSSNDVFTFGRAPICIEILTKISGLEFNSSYENAIETIWDSVNVRLIDIRDLRINKSASGRYKDLDDLEHLQ